MGLEQNNEQHYRIVVDKYNDPYAYYEMTTRDYVLRPNAVVGADPANVVIALPPVSEAMGRFYSIVCRWANVANPVTITDREDSECWLADIVMNGKCDRVLFYSDGLCWHPLCCGGIGTWPGINTTAPPGTTLAPTTVAPTSLAPTTTLTTAVPTTLAVTTVVPTTLGPSSAAPTTIGLTTVVPTSIEPRQTTVIPTTGIPASPTTPVLTTVAPTTIAPTTLEPTTAAPTTLEPTTTAPTTLAPTTLAPTTLAGTTVVPTTT